MVLFVVGGAGLVQWAWVSGRGPVGIAQWASFCGRRSVGVVQWAWSFGRGSVGDIQHLTAASRCAPQASGRRRRQRRVVWRSASGTRAACCGRFSPTVTVIWPRVTNRAETTSTTCPKSCPSSRSVGHRQPKIWGGNCEYSGAEVPCSIEPKMHRV